MDTAIAKEITSITIEEEKLHWQLRKLSVRKAKILEDFDYESVEVHNSKESWNKLAIAASAQLAQARSR